MSIFNKLEIANDDQAKEFDGATSLDDSHAFAEHQRSDAFKSNSQSKTKASGAWRAGKSLIQLKNQLNAAYPNRSKTSDGFIGDAAHCPNADGTGNSDHCPNIQDGDMRVVTAFDVTHDPQNGCDNNQLTESIRSSKDSRVKYIIWNRRICNAASIEGTPAWQWRTYNGDNPHTKHCHISVRAEKSKYDDSSNWAIQSASDAQNMS